MILVLLPAYNEEESLPQLMPKLKHTLTEMGEEFKILICNDGSKDGTQAMLEAYWHSPNSVDKYYCQNLNGRNANAKSQIHS